MNRSSAVLCQHIKDDGIRCGSPAMKNASWCYFHRRIYEAPMGRRNNPYRVGAMESTSSVQVVLTHALQALMDDVLDIKKANCLFRGLSLALQTLRPSQRQRLADTDFSRITADATEYGLPAEPGDDPQAVEIAGQYDHIPPVSPSLQNEHRLKPQTCVVTKKLPVPAELSSAELARIKKIVRRGPRHPQFRQCAQLLDAHIAAKRAG